MSSWTQKMFIWSWCKPILFLCLFMVYTFFFVMILTEVNRLIIILRYMGTIAFQSLSMRFVKIIQALYMPPSGQWSLIRLCGYIGWSESLESFYFIGSLVFKTAHTVNLQTCAVVNFSYLPWINSFPTVFIHDHPHCLIK